MEIEAIKKKETERNLEMENLGKQAGTTGTVINRIHEMKGWISDVEGMIGEIE